MVRGITFGNCAFETPLGRVGPESEVYFGLLLFVAAGDVAGVPRDELASLLWPTSGDDSSRHCLRQAMYRLRQLGAPVRFRGGRVALLPEECDFDVRRILHEKPSREELIRLGKLPFLPTYAPKIGDRYSRWVEDLRQRVGGRLRQVLAEAVTEAQARSRYREVGELARALRALDPLNEIATFGLAESLALEGSKVEAIRMLEAYEDEVGAVNGELRLPVRLLRRRVSERLDDSLLPRHFEVPFVGREAELTELRNIFGAAKGGEAQTVIITGEAGIGKTRLASELLRLAAFDGATPVAYTTSAGDTYTPLTTLVSVSQLLLSLPGSLGCDEEQLAYVRRLGTPETVGEWSVTGLAAEVAYAQMVSALAELVAAIADEAPLVLFVDDAHRLHQTTWRILMDLLDRVRDRRVMIILTARQLPAWFGMLGARSCERLTHQIRLEPFAREESLLFLTIWSNRNRVPIDDEDASSCAATSQGNPFYLGELAGHIGRGGDPRGAPASIKELIEMQHAALSTGAQRVLLVIALFGSRATLTRVAEILELSASEYIASLAEVEETGLIIADGLAVRCKHEMISTVSLGVTTQTVQSYLRARIAELLEAQADATNSIELLGDCVAQWESTGDRKRAFDAAMKLGNRLLTLGLGQDALDAFASARRCAASEHDVLRALEACVLAAFLSGDRGSTLVFAAARQEHMTSLGMPRRTADECALIEEDSRMFHDPTLWTPTNVLLWAADQSLPSATRLRAAAIASMFGDNSYNALLITQAYGLVRDLRPSDLMSNDAALVELVFHTSVGVARFVPTIANEYARMVRGTGDRLTQLRGLRRAGNALRRVGLLDEAIALIEEALSLATLLRLPGQELSTLEQLASSYCEAGDVPNGQRVLDRLITRVESTSTASMKLSLCFHKMAMAWLSSDVEMASRALEQKLPVPAGMQEVARHALLSATLGVTSLLSPDSISAADLADCSYLHQRGRGLGQQDLKTSMLLEAMRLSGNPAGAGTVAHDYLQIHRRELTPPRLPVLVRYVNAHHPTLNSEVVS